MRILCKILALSFISILLYGCAIFETVKYIQEGHRYINTGQYDKAMISYEKTLEIAHSIQDNYFTSAAENNIGGTYMMMEQYDKAIEFYNKSLQSAVRVTPERSKMEVYAGNYNNIAALYIFQQKYDKALEYCDKAIELNKKIKRSKGLALNLSLKGVVYYRLGQSAEAIDYLKQAVEYAKNPEWESKIDIGIYLKIIAVESLYYIGYIYHEQSNYMQAIRYLEEAADESDKMRNEIKVEDKLDYQALVKSIYQTLISSYIKNKDFVNTYKYVEKSHGRLLAEKLNIQVGTSDNIPTIDHIQNKMAKDTAIIMFANSDRNNIVIITLTKNSFDAREVSVNESLTTILKQNADAINKLTDNQRGLKFSKKNIGSQLFTKEDDSIERIINYYHSLITDFSPSDERSLKIKYKNLNDIKNYIGKDQEINRKKLSRILNSLLIDPSEIHINGKQKLIIVPDGMIAFLPFETLLDKEGKYLIEKHEITYIQSMSILDLVRQRKYEKNRKSLLALGGAVYDHLDSNVETVSNSGQLEYLKKRVYEISENKESFRNIYFALGIVNWDDLPGTKEEVNEIGKKVTDSKIMAGSEATEDLIKKMSKNGELANYKVIHFATHGLVVPEIPELSSIVLSQFKKEREGEDGYLRMEEISKLNVRADLVTLSACQTGIGKIYGGEGVIGLTQSFLIAGANSALSSLWSVDDLSTSKFMIAIYESVKNQGVEYSDAIANVKRRFINGEFGRKYQEPYYWAPFVYYGK